MFYPCASAESIPAELVDEGSVTAWAGHGREDRGRKGREVLLVPIALGVLLDGRAALARSPREGRQQRRSDRQPGAQRIALSAAGHTIRML